MWRSLLSVAIAALLAAGLPTMAQDQVHGLALAQLKISLVEWAVAAKGSHPDALRHDRLVALVSTPRKVEGR